MTTLAVILLALAFAIACPMTAVMRAAAHKWGQLDHPGERKIHDRPIPATGGVAIYLGIALPLLAGMIAAWVLPESFWSGVAPSIVEHLPGLRHQTPMGVTLLGCLTALHVMGLVDDRQNLGPVVKLVVQLVAAGVLAAFFDVRLMEMLGPTGSIIATILWFGVITNAFNFLDNMDGLSGGVAAICGTIFLASALIGGQWFVAAAAALLVGAVLGFLVFNYPPASIFMGDGGSLVLGFLIAFISVRITYVPTELTSATSPGWWATLTPVVVLAIPLYDITSVTLIRIAQGRSPLVGDTQHFSHRLVRKGLSRRAAVGVIYACTLATGLGGVILARLTGAQAALVFIQTAMILVVIALLERTRNHNEL
ncbi:MAG: hypothetical protein GC159_00880 [Phycisphaera sp.]|nr:hypothetical protein [Phycisphaera sp.]